MRRGYYLSTALVTTLRHGHAAAETPTLPEFGAVLAWRPSDDPSSADARRISASSFCSDGEIFLEGDLPFQTLMRS